MLADIDRQSERHISKHVQGTLGLLEAALVFRYVE